MSKIHSRDLLRMRIVLRNKNSQTIMMLLTAAMFLSQTAVYRWLRNALCSMHTNKMEQCIAAITLCSHLMTQIVQYVVTFCYKPWVINLYKTKSHTTARITACPYYKRKTKYVSLFCDPFHTSLSGHRLSTGNKEISLGHTHTC